MKRIIALTVGSLLLLTACSRNNTGVAEVPPSPSPSFPPIKGPSAVFTATPDPNATPYPTNAPTPTPTLALRFINTTSSSADNHKYYGFVPCCSCDVALAAAKFDYDTDPFDSKRRDGESAEEYKKRMFSNIQAKYEELLRELDSMTSLYIHIESLGNDDIALPRYNDDIYDDFKAANIYAVLRGKTLEKWKGFIRSSMLKFNNDYNDDETGPVRAGCTDSSIIYCFENKDGKLFCMFNNTRISPKYSGFSGMAELKFDSADKAAEFLMFQREIETEAITRLYGMYFSPACYPFLDIDEPIYSSKPKSALNDKFLYSTGTPVYKFDIRENAGVPSGGFKNAETVYICIERNGKKYYAAFAERSYIDKLHNLISKSATVDYKSEDTLSDGGKITFCVYNDQMNCIVKVLSTNGVSFDASGVPVKKLKFRDTASEKEFMSLQQRIYDEILKMRTASSPYCLDHVINNVG